MNMANKQIHGINKQRGMGLIEIVIAVFVVMLGTASVGRMLTYSASTAGQSKARAEALALAEAKLEVLRDFATGAAYSSSVVASTAAETHTGTNANFAVTWAVATNTAPDYKTATVNVGWADQIGSQSVNLASNLGYDNPVESGKFFAREGGLNSPGGGAAQGEPTTEEEANPYAESETPPGEGEATDLGEIHVATTTPPYTLTIAGSIDVDNGVQFSGVFGSGNYGVACTYSTNSYTCTIPDIAHADTWTGSISVASNKTVCEGARLSYSAISANQSQDYILRNQSSHC
jgi:Tfp pilus assembly protein PilV